MWPSCESRLETPARRSGSSVSSATLIGSRTDIRGTFGFRVMTLRFNLATPDVRVKPRFPCTFGQDVATGSRKPDRFRAPTQPIGGFSRTAAGCTVFLMAQPNVFHALDQALAAAVASAAPSVLHVARGHGHGGTGIAWSDNLVVTASFHTPDQTRIGIGTDGDLDLRDAKVIGRDPGTDVALLEVDTTSPAARGKGSLA